jgi:hypothetical protein
LEFLASAMRYEEEMKRMQIGKGFLKISVRMSLGYLVGIVLNM